MRLRPQQQPEGPAAEPAREAAVAAAESRGLGQGAPDPGRDGHGTLRLPSAAELAAAPDVAVEAVEADAAAAEEAARARVRGGG